MSKLKIPLIVILGPTASGKSQMAVLLCQKFNGYVISADSRQIYKEMDVATAKITKTEMSGIDHKLIDILNPDQTYSVAQFQHDAYDIIKKEPNKTPFLVGGTGLYISAVTKGYTFKKSTASKKPDFLSILTLGISINRKILYEKINDRVEKMFDENIIEEATHLLKKYPTTIPSMTGIGYSHINDYLTKKITLKNCKELIKRDSRHYAKRQLTWFRSDKSIIWIENLRQAKDHTEKFLTQ